MWIDPIVEEVRKQRRACAAEHNNDLDAIYEDIRRREAASTRKKVALPPKRCQPMASRARR